MTQITLKRSEVQQIVDLCNHHNKTIWFIAKDQGAYVGATGGSQEEGNFENVIFYFKGMDPSKNEYAYDNAVDAFGGDDFGERMNLDIWVKLLKDDTFVSATIKVTSASISISSRHSKAKPTIAPKAKPTIAPSTPSKKVSKGSLIKDLINKGWDNEAILRKVETTINSVRWYRSQMKHA